jgi:isopenicillin-N epimerase
MPLDSIVPLLKARGIVTVIDGAHALGHLRGGLDIPSMGVDFYVTNGHKW